MRSNLPVSGTEVRMQPSLPMAPAASAVRAATAIVHEIAHNGRGQCGAAIVKRMLARLEALTALTLAGRHCARVRASSASSAPGVSVADAPATLAQALSVYELAVRDGLRSRPFLMHVKDFMA